jgi:TM2 domain
MRQTRYVLRMVPLEVADSCSDGLGYRVAGILGICAVALGFGLLRCAIAWLGMILRQWGLNRLHRAGASGRMQSSDRQTTGRSGKELPTAWDDLHPDTEATAGPITVVSIESSARLLRRRTLIAVAAVILGGLGLLTAMPFQALFVFLFPITSPLIAFTIWVLVLMFNPRPKPLYISLKTFNLGLSFVVFIAISIGVFFAFIAGGAFVCADPATDSHVRTLAISLTALSVGAVLLRVARYRDSVRAAGVLSVDPRPPVLYLRSFGDDRTDVWVHPFFSPSRYDFFIGPPRRRFEEVIAWHLWQHGPVVAVNPPGRRSQPVGAAREQLMLDSWREAIDDWLWSSKLIILSLGSTAGVKWELDHIRAMALISKTVILFPPVGEAELAARWTQSLYGSATGIAGALSAVLGRDDSLTVYVGKKRSMWWYAAALEAAIGLLDLPKYGNFYFSGPRPGETTLETLDMRPPRPYHSDNDYYLFIDGVVKGPYGLIDLRGLAHSRAVSARTQVYIGKQWKSLGDIHEVYSTRSWAVALACSILLGWLGIDRFYLGKIGSGMVKLLTFGGLGAWWLMDLVLTLAHAVNDASGKPLR